MPLGEDGMCPLMGGRNDFCSPQRKLRSVVLQLETYFCAEQMSKKKSSRMRVSPVPSGPAPYRRRAQIWHARLHLSTNALLLTLLHPCSICPLSTELDYLLTIVPETISPLHRWGNWGSEQEISCKGRGVEWCCGVCVLGCCLTLSCYSFINCDVIWASTIPGLSHEVIGLSPF